MVRSSKRESASSVSWRVMADSQIEVYFGVEANRETVIYLNGPAAEIPAIKNGKIPGKTSTEPTRLGRVLALDALWMRATRNIPLSLQQVYGTEPVCLTVFFGKRKYAYDSDNALTTIRDWLEPSNKKVSGRSRGWGIGIIKSDKNVVSYALKASDIGSVSKTTIIHITPFKDNAKQVSLEFVSKLTSGRIAV